jgi:hypothetical protein
MTLLPFTDVIAFNCAVSDWPTQLLPPEGVTDAPLPERLAGMQLLDTIVTVQLEEQAPTE